MGQQGLYGKTSQQNDFGQFSGFNQTSYQMDRSRAKRKATTIDGQARRVKPAATSSYKIGDRVFHDKFGYGHVTSIDGTKLEIDFEQGSARKVMESFIKPA